MILKNEENTTSHEKTPKNIQLVGCGEFYDDILQSGLLDDVNILKVVLNADIGLKYFKKSSDSKFLEIPRFLGELTPEHTEEVVLENLSEIINFTNVDLLFLTCEMAINPCTGYISALAAAARNQGAFVIAVTPSNQGIYYWREKESSWISKLEKNTDMLISIPFNRLTGASLNSSVKECYNLLVLIVAMVIKDISSHVEGEGSVEGAGFLKHPYFRDAESLKIIRESSQARVGFGVGYGKEAFLESAKNALKCPLLTFDLKEARMAIVTVSGDVCLYEAEKIAQNVAFAANLGTSIFWDVFPEKTNDGKIQILIIALR